MEKIPIESGRGPYGHYLAAYTCACGKPMQARAADVVAGKVRQCKSCANRTRQRALDKTKGEQK
jgi:hypothetical protein